MKSPHGGGGGGGAGRLRISQNMDAFQTFTCAALINAESMRLKRCLIFL